MPSVFILIDPLHQQIRLHLPIPEPKRDYTLWKQVVLNALSCFA